jgi:hypothetical protein
MTRRRRQRLAAIGGPTVNLQVRATTLALWRSIELSVTLRNRVSIGRRLSAEYEAAI